MVELWLRRLFWLAALVTGVGGTLSFTYLSIRHGPSELVLYIWPCITVALGAIAFRGVRRAWRESPSNLRGLFQWRLSDLLTSSLLTGALMTALLALRPKATPLFDVPVSMICGFGFAAGLLVAARVGLGGWKRRHLYATGFSLRILGLVALALSVYLSLCLILESVLRWPSFADFIRHRFEESQWIEVDGIDCNIVCTFFVTPFALFAVGHALCCVAARNKPSPPEQQLPSATTP